MGVPIKISLEDDRVIFVCCEGCEDPVKQDPDKYFAVLASHGGEGEHADDSAAEGESESEG